MYSPPVAAFRSRETMCLPRNPLSRPLHPVPVGLQPSLDDWIWTQGSKVTRRLEVKATEAAPMLPVRQNRLPLLGPRLEPT